MKIICIGRNYQKHAAELNNPVPEEPVVFCKPDTAVLKNNAPFYHPDFSDNIHYEAELVIRISRAGKYIDKEFARKYYDKITLGIDFTARDLQQKAKDGGKPWETAKAFDGSAPIGKFKDITKDVSEYSFELLKNGKAVQKGNASDMIFHADEVISYVSRFFTLRVGDLIFTGTPEGVGSIAKGDVFEGILEGEKVLRTEIK